MTIVDTFDGRTRIRNEPVALDEVPQVSALLQRLGLGAFDGEVESHVGRNENWSGRTTSGQHVIVKQLAGNSPEDGRSRYDRHLSFDTVTRVPGCSTPPHPRLVGSDPELLLVVSEFIEDAQSGAELLVQESFDADLCRRAGELVALLHDLPPDATVIDDTPHPSPPVELSGALPLRNFTAAPYGELEAWRIIQNDQSLIDALVRLRQREANRAYSCPIHGDMRLDQFLYAHEELYLTDWEEFRIGDPARDVGDFIGEWLYIAIRRVPRAIAEDAGSIVNKVDATHEEILDRGGRELERLVPLMTEFWRRYRATRVGRIDDEFPVRAAAQAGWHIMERMFATAASDGRLSAADRAASGIGRTILVAPEKFTEELGLVDSDE